MGAYIEALEAGGSAVERLVRRAQELGTVDDPAAYQQLERELAAGNLGRQPASNAYEEALRLDAEAAGGEGAADEEDEDDAEAEAGEPDDDELEDEAGDEEEAPKPARKASGKAAPAAALPPDDAHFAFGELRRAGFTPDEVAEMLTSRPERALALARGFKQTRDALLRPSPPGGRPSKPGSEPPKTDPPDAAGGPPEGDPSDEELTEALASVLGPEVAQRLLNRLPGKAAQAREGRASDLESVRAETERVRGELLGGGAEQLRDDALWSQVLVSADALQQRAARDGKTLSNAAAIKGAWGAVQKLANTNPTPPRRAATRATPALSTRASTERRLSRDEAMTRYIQALEAGKPNKAREVQKRYGL